MDLHLKLGTSEVVWKHLIYDQITNPDVLTEPHTRDTAIHDTQTSSPTSKDNQIARPDVLTEPLI